MAETISEEIRRFAEQQHALFGDIIVNRGVRRIDPGQILERAEDAPTDLFGESLSPFAARLSSIDEDWVGATSLESLKQMICNCQSCPLGKTRNKFVFGVGNPNADVVVIGEAPGADEDKSGEPFVGMAGQLLTKILAAIHFSREDVYICNILKSRPPGNRTPERSEVEQCIPYLYKQLDLIKPKFILAVGLTAANGLLNTKSTMRELRGKVHDYHGIRMIVTYHPAALLRNSQWKRPTWEDVQHLRRLYDEWKNETA